MNQRRNLSLDELLRASPAALEAAFADDRPIAVPEGRFRGRTLCRLDNPGARRPLWRASQKVGFEWLPYGVDFGRRTWFFVHPPIAVGRFQPRVQRSRWRDTQVVALHYEASRLPAAIRRTLYDEVKPLGPDLLLGIGGINAGPGQGDHFFFLLTRS